MDENAMLPDAARDRIGGEINDCQERIVRVLVPTIISFGLSAIGNLGTGGGNGPLGYEIIFGGLFAVLFSSSLYIASLSYKIFERAAFLRYFDDDDEDWETIVNAYRSTYTPRFIGSETSAIAWIYLTLALLFGWVFWGTVPLVAVVPATLFLLGVAGRIWFIPRSVTERKLDRRMKAVLSTSDERSRLVGEPAPQNDD